MRLHIDTDMGVDDGLALAVAAGLPEVEIAAVSAVFGNVALPVVVRNALLFRRLLGASWPVIAGAAGTGGAPDATHVHGEDGLGGATAGFDTQALGEAVPLARFAPPPGAVVLLGIGPASNIPGLVARYGPGGIARIVLMAGAVFDRGNITERAEFNALCDPAALEAALGTGLPTTLVPLDLCRKVLLTPATVAGWRTDTAAMRLVARSHAAYIARTGAWDDVEGCFPHDTVALLAAVAPERFLSFPGRVTVGGDGATRFAADDRSPVCVALGGDLPWVRRFLRLA